MRQDASNEGDGIAARHGIGGVSRIAIPAGSPAIGRTLRSLDIRAKTGASVVAVERAGNRFRNPGPSWTFEAGDVAVVICDPPQLAALHELFAVRNAR